MYPTYSEKYKNYFILNSIFYNMFNLVFRLLRLPHKHGKISLKCFKINGIKNEDFKDIYDFLVTDYLFYLDLAVVSCVLELITWPSQGYI